MGKLQKNVVCVHNIYTYLFIMHIHIAEVKYLAKFVQFYKVNYILSFSRKKLPIQHHGDLERSIF